MGWSNNDILRKVFYQSFLLEQRLRQKQDRWAKRVTEWYPKEGKRSRGRQRIRSSDDFVKMMGATWQRLARDRDAWKEMEEAFVQRAY
ncbi:jg10411 [Pararge aegeria aegeria]|uniref:Jg10411 protein n=1 Tax=Pararge aegeria aegeria TaxID=348720 RepID=A0A8S4RNY6_9NEOP|nr:jg10411 [Pararge aegeria aegeria]